MEELVIIRANATDQNALTRRILHFTVHETDMVCALGDLDRIVARVHGIEHQAVHNDIALYMTLICLEMKRPSSAWIRLDDRSIRRVICSQSYRIVPIYATGDIVHE